MASIAAQKLGNYFRHDSESIATKVCSPIGSKWNVNCLRKERLLRFELNSKATSDGSAPILVVCSQISSEWNVMFENHVVTSVDRISFDFWLEDFLSNLSLQTIIYCVTDQPSITWSPRSVLNFKFSALNFLRSMSCSMSNEQKWVEVKMFQLHSM